jgi:hypothetical protein
MDSNLVDNVLLYKKKTPWSESASELYRPSISCYIHIQNTFTSSSLSLHHSMFNGGFMMKELCKKSVTWQNLPTSTLHDS